MAERTVTYHEGWETAADDIGAGYERNEDAIAALAPADWVRGYFARMALQARVEARRRG
jgi:hypothetical protein